MGSFGGCPTTIDQGVAAYKERYVKKQVMKNTDIEHMQLIDVSIKWPFKWCLVGSSGSGKTNFSHQIICNASKIFDKAPERLVVIYKEYQKIYDRFQDLIDTKLIHEDEVDLEELTASNNDRLLIICDDLYFSKKLDEVAEHFLIKGRHRNISWLVLTQSIFNRPALRNISRNSTHITIFKTVRLNEPHIFFSQLRPKSSKVLQNIFLKATDQSYSYLDIDLSQTCPDKLRYKTKIFQKKVTVFIIMGDSFKTMYLISSADLDSERNDNFKLTVQNRDVCNDGLNISVKPVTKRRGAVKPTANNEHIEKEDVKNDDKHKGINFKQSDSFGEEDVNYSYNPNDKAVDDSPKANDKVVDNRLNPSDTIEENTKDWLAEKNESKNLETETNSEIKNENRKAKPEIIDPYKLKKAQRFNPYPFLEPNSRKSLISNKSIDPSIRKYEESAGIDSRDNQAQQGENSDGNITAGAKDLIEQMKPDDDSKKNEDEWVKGLKSRLSERTAQFKRKHDTVGVRVMKNDAKKSLIRPGDFKFLNKDESSQFLDTWKPLKEMSNKKMKTVSDRKFNPIPIKKFKRYPYYIR